MRIETLLQDNAVRDAMAAFAFAWAHQHEDAERGAETVEQARAHAAKTLLLALAGAGEEETLEEVVAYMVKYHGSHHTYAKTVYETVGPILRAPLLAKVATLEAENETLAIAVRTAGGDTKGYLALIGEMAKVVEAIRKVCPSDETTGVTESFTYVCHDEDGEPILETNSLSEVVDWLVGQQSDMYEYYESRLSTVEAERDRLAGENLKLEAGIQAVRDFEQESHLLHMRRITTLEAAIAEYASHKVTCPRNSFNPIEGWAKPCTCGLDTLLGETGR